MQRLLTRGIPEELQQWTEVNSVNNLRSYTASLNVPLEDIQRYLVYRIPSSTVEKESTPETSQEVNKVPYSRGIIQVLRQNLRRG